ncbi:MAG: glycosyltransferase family 2 protein [Patescibacteria group bacterium]|nr:glycosyltransferase family 2 protein [Patescibacteria group bacterium]
MKIYPVTEHTRLHFVHPPRKGFISVIVPVYKDHQGLSDTLESLARQTLSQKRFEVIVGNDSADPACTKVCRKYSFVREVATETNSGAYAMRNLAIEASRGEYLAFTDADIRVPPYWLETFLVHFSQGLDYIGGDVIIDPEKIRTLTNRLVAEYEFDNKDVFAKHHFIPTANVAVRRSVMETIGGFDRRLYSSGDCEFGDRVFRHGMYRQFYIESIPVIHPPRDYDAFMKKLARISRGQADLRAYYPERFGNSGGVSICNEFRRAFYIPHIKSARNSIDKIMLTGLVVWFQLWRALNNVKNSLLLRSKKGK